MPPEESIEAVSSEGGNGVPPVESTPSEPVETVPPTDPQEPVTPPSEPAEPELIELPDGRKVDGATVAQEYKNLLSDYTRKSQELAQFKQTGQQQITTDPAQVAQQEEWQPQTWSEIVQKAKEEMKADLAREQQQEQEQIRSIEDAVANQLAEIKTKDPNLNENALFVHATKYGFRDLKLAHQNMQDMSHAIKTTQQKTVENVQKRNDPVSGRPGGSPGARPDPSNFQNARDYLRSLN